MTEGSPVSKTVLEQEDAVPVPLPLVTDLDGDGQNEVLTLVEGGDRLRVLSVPVSSGENMVIKFGVSWLRLACTVKVGEIASGARTPGGVP